MRLTLLGFVLLLTGCASQFDGEWLEQGARGGTDAGRRMAIKFESPSTVRYGIYDNAASAVDSQSVQISSYFLFDRARRAQFGAMIARVEGDHLFADVGEDVHRRFTKIKGPSIFPPPVKLPELSSSSDVPAIWTPNDVAAALNILSVCPLIG